MPFAGVLHFTILRLFTPQPLPRLLILRSWNVLPLCFTIHRQKRAILHQMGSSKAYTLNTFTEHMYLVICWDNDTHPTTQEKSSPGYRYQKKALQPGPNLYVAILVSPQAVRQRSCPWYFQKVVLSGRWHGGLHVNQVTLDSWEAKKAVLGLYVYHESLRLKIPTSRNPKRLAMSSTSHAHTIISHQHR